MVTNWGRYKKWLYTETIPSSIGSDHARVRRKKPSVGNDRERSLSVRTFAQFFIRTRLVRLFLLPTAFRLLHTVSKNQIHTRCIRHIHAICPRLTTCNNSACRDMKPLSIISIWRSSSCKTLCNIFEVQNVQIVNSKLTSVFWTTAYMADRQKLHRYTKPSMIRRSAITHIHTEREERNNE